MLMFGSQLRGSLDASKSAQFEFKRIIASRFLLIQMKSITSMSTTAEQKDSSCRNWDG